MGMTHKTLVINHNSKHWEFYGHLDGFGWCTSMTPIQIMSKEATWDDVLKAFPNENFDDVDLVTIEITIGAWDSKFGLEFCEDCIQMTNHMGGICQKCKK